MHKSKANHARWDSERHTLRERKRVCVYVSSWVDFTGFLHQYVISHTQMTKSKVSHTRWDVERNTNEGEKARVCVCEFWYDMT